MHLVVISIPCLASLACIWKMCRNGYDERLDLWAKLLAVIAMLANLIFVICQVLG